jgi:hypothetical protein
MAATPPMEPADVTAQPALPSSFPESLQGVWGEITGGSPTSDECRYDVNSFDNFGKVLTIRADGFDLFELGGRPLEVHERGENRFVATFDTTYGDTPTQDRLAFSVDGGVLTLSGGERLVGSSDVSYAACPKTTTAPVQDAAPELKLDRLTSAAVTAAGVEAIGCWFRVGSADSDPVFFITDEAAVLMVDGATIVLPETTSDRSPSTAIVEPGLTVSGDGYAATFVLVGEPRPTNIESNERDVRLAVSAPGRTITFLDGALWCGV